MRYSRSLHVLLCALSVPFPEDHHAFAETAYGTLGSHGAAHRCRIAWAIKKPEQCQPQSISSELVC